MSTTSSLSVDQFYDGTNEEFLERLDSFGALGAGRRTDSLELPAGGPLTFSQHHVHRLF